MNDQSRIDPRYAAQFQRGFDPAVHAPVVTSPRSGGPERLPGGPIAEATHVALPPPIVARSDATPPGVPAEDVEASEPAPTRGSRLIEWSLPIFAGILFAASIGLFLDMIGDAQLFTGYTDPGAWQWAQVRASLPAPLFLAGVVATTAWIVLRALAPRGERR